MSLSELGLPGPRYFVKILGLYALAAVVGFIGFAVYLLGGVLWRDLGAAAEVLSEIGAVVIAVVILGGGWGWAEIGRRSSKRRH